MSYGENSFWTKERIETLRKMHADGVTYGQIADRIGCTRNAAIGKGKRLGLVGSRTISDGMKAHHAAIRGPSKIRRRGNQHGGLAFKIARGALGKKPVWKTPIAEPLKPPTCDPVLLMDAEPHNCRFVLGNPAGPKTKFCGAHRVIGRSFCGFHARLAYQPPQPRRDRSLERMAGAP